MKYRREVTENTNPDDAENCERMIEYLREATDTLEAIHRSRPKQRKIRFDKPESEDNGVAKRGKKALKE